jgi:crotonobetainyl-CoA:carnitine CoA-transferase CaiB-like acyl-CoA transferase
MTGPLAGLRVVDCSRGTAGPQLTGLLADYGADVLWVEPPGGDPYRDVLAVPYSVYNRGKRSIVLDLKTTEGRDALRSRLSSADVFVMSWRPGVATRLGLDGEQLLREFPALVCCSLSGFGPDGAQGDLPGYEALVHAVVGSMGEQGGYRDGPIYEALPFASSGAVYLGAMGVLAALYRRGIDGVGRFVETSLLDGALAYLSMLWAHDVNGSPLSSPRGRRLVVGYMRCAGDDYLGVHTGAVGAFDRLMSLVGLAEGFPPDRGATSTGGLVSPEQQRLLQEELPQIFASKPREHWLPLLLEADICAVPVLAPGQAFDEPQVRHNQLAATLDDPVLGPVDQVARTIRFGASGGPLQPAPRVDERGDLNFSDGAPARKEAVQTNSGTVWPALLDGVKVLDFGAYYAGPYASRLLADLGAEVIKLEPLAGDQLRGMDRPYGSASAGKRAIAVDLKNEAGRPIGDRLLAWADVITHNLRPGAAERLGMSYADAESVNSDAVYLYAPGWGSSGPDRLRQSFAPLLSGYVGVTGEVAGRGNPPVMPVGNEDPGNGLLGAVAVLIALVHRQRTGNGQFLEAPQLNAALAHMAHVVRRADGTVLGAERLDQQQLGFGAFDRLYRCRDGWICLVVYSEPQITRLEDALGLKLSSEIGAPAECLSSILEQRFLELSVHEAVGTLNAHGVPVAVPRSRNDEAFLTDPANVRSRRVAACPHPTRGTVRELDLLLRVSRSTPPSHRLAPALGEHTDEILSMLGYDETARSQLHAAGAVRSVPA